MDPTTTQANFQVHMYICSEIKGIFSLDFSPWFFLLKGPAPLVFDSYCNLVCKRRISRLTRYILMCKFEKVYKNIQYSIIKQSSFFLFKYPFPSMPLHLFSTVLPHSFSDSQWKKYLNNLKLYLLQNSRRCTVRWWALGQWATWPWAPPPTSPSPPCPPARTPI
jgi:hypothetical protein